jgi:hypothetical protein
MSLRVPAAGEGGIEGGGRRERSLWALQLTWRREHRTDMLGMTAVLV